MLRAGDGGSSPASDLAAHQTPVFIDQYDPGMANQPRPSFTVAIPVTGSNALWINGNASTEGGMARSADRTVLTISGYCGDILSKKGTPSRQAYNRGICVIANDGSTRLAYSGTNWYGLSGGKTNPRGAVTDGTNNFWGCGSEIGTLFYNTAGNDPLLIKSVASTRAIRILNGTLYFSIMTSDGLGAGAEGPVGGIYRFCGCLRRAGGASDQCVCPHKPRRPIRSALQSRRRFRHQSPRQPGVYGGRSQRRPKIRKNRK